MENGTEQPTPAIPEKIARVSSEIATEIVRGTEAVVHEAAQALVHAAQRIAAAPAVSGQDVDKPGEALESRAPPAPSKASPETPVPTAALAAAIAAQP